MKTVLFVCVHNAGRSQMAEAFTNCLAAERGLLVFIHGWENVKESDIVEHGDPHPAEFDRDDAREWLADRPDLFGAITEGLLAGYKAHTAELEEKLKNSSPGSNSSTPQDSTQAASA